MDLTDQERNLILAGLFELTITYADDDEQRERCKTLAAKLGGDPDELAAHLAKYPAGKELGLIFTNDQGEPISRTVSRSTCGSPRFPQPRSPRASASTRCATITPRFSSRKAQA